MSKSRKGALTGGKIGATLFGAPVTYIIWRNTSEKTRKEIARKDAEQRRKMKKAEQEYKSWKDIEIKLVYKVPEELIKFIDLTKNKGLICEYVPYIDTPAILGKCIEDVIASEGKYYSESRWEELTLIGNGVGDDESDNFYYDFNNKTWNDYGWVKGKRSLKEIILNSYKNEYWLEDIKEQGFSEEDIQESINLIKKEL